MSWFRRVTPVQQQLDCCRDCAHFTNDPQEMERQMPGLSSFCSGTASVRADDGLCDRHGLYLRATDHCEQWQARPKP